tara:strand:+ start:1553 stop:1897 length:345 start_codon:yes stop_codon:yes gene_type:complete
MSPTKKEIIKALASSELFACPFCGSKAKHDEEQAYSLDSSYEYIGCTKCPARIPIWNSKEEAVKQWNLRAAADSRPASCSGDVVSWDQWKQSLDLTHLVSWANAEVCDPSKSEL